jgi:hypothetical protein
MPREISIATARRFLAIRHLLAPPRALPASPESVLAVVDRLGSLQFDPLEVAGRNHDLVLAARIAGYRRGLTDELLYGRRLLFEAYNKSLNLLPTRELPYYRISWQNGDGRAGGLLREQAALAEKLLAAITAEGPKCSSDFERSEAHRLVVGADIGRSGGARGPGRFRSTGAGATRRQPPLLRPDRAPVPRRPPGRPGPGTRAAAPQAAVPVPWPRAARRVRQRRAMARHRKGAAADGASGRARGSRRDRGCGRRGDARRAVRRRRRAAAAGPGRTRGGGRIGRRRGAGRQPFPARRRSARLQLHRPTRPADVGSRRA